MKSITQLLAERAALLAALKAEQIKTAAAYGLAHPKKVGSIRASPTAYNSGAERNIMCDKVEIRYEWTCPHCGHRNRNLATVRDRYGSLSPALVYCDIEDGGCDRMVAVKPRLSVQTEVYRVVNPTDNQMDDAIIDAQAEADESMVDHLDNIQRAREQMDGLRRGMGLEE